MGCLESAGCGCLALLLFFGALPSILGDPLGKLVLLAALSAALVAHLRRVRARDSSSPKQRPRNLATGILICGMVLVTASLFNPSNRKARVQDPGSQVTPRTSAPPTSMPRRSVEAQTESAQGAESSVAPRTPAESLGRTIIGARREAVITQFSSHEWTRNYRYESNVDAEAVKFESEDLIIVVDFDERGVAEGVSFLTQGPSLRVDDPSGCYVATHLEDLLSWARGIHEVSYEVDAQPHPCELYVGRTHLE